jgi:hypothetical protein
VHLVAVADESVSERPPPSRDEVIDRVRERPDIVALGRILGDLRFDATYAPAADRWIVRAFDPSERLLRELLVSSEE